jgi:hypothetical protein
VLGNDFDPDAPLTPLEAQLFSGPSKGALTLNLDGSFTYTPTSVALATGQDKFFYVARNGTVDSDPAAVTINFGPPVNHAPVAVGDAPSFITNNTSNPGGTPATVSLLLPPPSVLVNDSDPDVGDVLHVGAFSGLTGANTGATLAIDQTTGANAGRVTFGYASNWVGDATYNYSAQDSGTPPLSSAAVPNHIVRDIAIRSAATQIVTLTTGRWNVTFRARTLPAAVTYELVPSRTSAGTACPLALLPNPVVATVTVPANTPVTAAFFTLQSATTASAQRAGCDTLTVRTAASTPIPLANTVPAHPAATSVTTTLLPPPFNHFTVFNSLP